MIRCDDKHVAAPGRGLDRSSGLPAGEGIDHAATRTAGCVFMAKARPCRSGFYPQEITLRCGSRTVRRTKHMGSHRTRFAKGPLPKSRLDRDRFRPGGSGYSDRHNSVQRTAPGSAHCKALLHHYVISVGTLRAELALRGKTVPEREYVHNTMPSSTPLGSWGEVDGACLPPGESRPGRGGVAGEEALDLAPLLHTLQRHRPKRPPARYPVKPLRSTPCRTGTASVIIQRCAARFWTGPWHLGRGRRAWGLATSGRIPGREAHLPPDSRPSLEDSPSASAGSSPKDPSARQGSPAPGAKTRPPRLHSTGAAAQSPSPPPFPSPYPQKRPLPWPSDWMSPPGSP